MLSLTPSPVSERRSSWLAPFLEEGTRAARGPLERALAGDPPSRILRAGGSSVDHLVLEALFPDATVRVGAMAEGRHRPPWAGWPDLVVTAHGLSPRAVDPASALAGLWRSMPVGGRLAVVDLYDGTPATRRFLEGQGRVCDPRLLEALCAAFTPIRAEILEHRSGLQTLVFVGRRA